MTVPKFIDDYYDAWEAANPGNPFGPRIVAGESRGQYRFDGVANVFDRKQIMDSTKILIGKAKRNDEVRQGIAKMADQVEISDPEQLRAHLTTLAETDLYLFSVGFAKACSIGEGQQFIDENLPRAPRP